MDKLVVAIAFMASLVLCLMMPKGVRATCDGTNQAVCDGVEITDNANYRVYFSGLGVVDKIAVESSATGIASSNMYPFVNQYFITPGSALTVAKSGSGTVKADIGTLYWDGSNGSASFVNGTVVTLTSTPDAGATFAGWSGACTGTGACTVTMDEAKTITAAFIPSAAQLVLTFSGEGSGTVVSTPEGMACNTNCSGAFERDLSVTLQATASAFSDFIGWSGACSGRANCEVTMTADQAVTATFVKDLAHYARIDRQSPAYFAALGTACSDAQNGEIVKAWGTIFTENLNLSLGRNLTIRGGFNDAYTSNLGGVTILNGRLNIRSGRLTVEKLKIK